MRCAKYIVTGACAVESFDLTDIAKSKSMGLKGAVKVVPFNYEVKLSGIDTLADGELLDGLKLTIQNACMEKYAGKLKAENISIQSYCMVDIWTEQQELATQATSNQQPRAQA